MGHCASFCDCSGDGESAPTSHQYLYTSTSTTQATSNDVITVDMIGELVHREYPHSSYEAYHDLMTKNNLDGSKLMSLDDEMIADYIMQIGISNMLHRMTIAEELINIKNKIMTSDAPIELFNANSHHGSSKVLHIIEELSESLDAASTAVSTNLISKIVDLNQVMDQLTTILPFDSLDNKYKLMMSDYAYLWMMLTRIMIKNSKNSVSAESIKTFDRKRMIPVHTRVFYQQLGKSGLIISDDTVVDHQPSVQQSTQCVYLRFAMTDEDSGDLTSNQAKKKLFDDIRGMYLLESRKQKQEQLSYFESNHIGKQVGRDIFNNCMPSSEVEWPELQSDDALSSMIFSGLGQVYLQRCSRSLKEYERICKNYSVTYNHRTILIYFT